MIGKLIMLMLKILGKAIILMICIGLVFIVYKANQPMTVADAPQGMTFVEFMKDRIEAAKTVEPSRCGWGMMLSLVTLGPIYSVVYTAVAINPDGTLAKMTAPDPDIPQGGGRRQVVRSSENFVGRGRTVILDDAGEAGQCWMSI
jgi:hypothetical protein